MYAKHLPLKACECWAKKPTAPTGGTHFPYVFLKPLQSPTKMRDQQQCVKRSPIVVQKLPISSWDDHSKESIKHKSNKNSFAQHRAQSEEEIKLKEKNICVVVCSLVPKAECPPVHKSAEV